jgi:hypothetical protein
MSFLMFLIKKNTQQAVLQIVTLKQIKNKSNLIFTKKIFSKHNLFTIKALKNNYHSSKLNIRLRATNNASF